MKLLYQPCSPCWLACRLLISLPALIFMASHFCVRWPLFRSCCRRLWSRRASMRCSVRAAGSISRSCIYLHWTVRRFNLSVRWARSCWLTFFTTPRLWFALSAMRSPGSILNLNRPPVLSGRMNAEFGGMWRCPCCVLRYSPHHCWSFCLTSPALASSFCLAARPLPRSKWRFIFKHCKC